MNRIKVGLTVGVIAAVAAGAPWSAMATSVQTDAAKVAVVVSTVASSAAATQTGGIIAGAVGGALGIGGPTGAGAPISSLDSKSVVSMNSRNLSGQSAQAADKRLGVWLQGNYTWIDNDETGGEFDGSVYNILAGIDYNPRILSDRLVVGLAFGYENLDIDTAFNVGTYEGDGFTVAPYAGFRINNNWAVDASVGYSWLDYDIKRTRPTTVTGSTDAERLFGSANLTGTYMFQQNKVRVSPKVGIMGLKEDQDSYRDSRGTNVEEVTIHLGRLSGGAEVGYNFGGIEPFARAGVEYDFNRNGSVRLTNNVVSSNDEVAGVFGLGVNINRGSLSGQILGTTSQFRDEVTTYGITARIRTEF